MDPFIQQRLQRYKAFGVKRVRAQASGRSDECVCCRALDGLTYAIDEVPEFPPRGCACAVGCGCLVTQILDDDVPAITVREDDLEQTAGAEVAPTSSVEIRSDTPGLQSEAKEHWSRFLSSAWRMTTSAGHLLRILGIWTAWILARGTAHCIRFISTTFPRYAKRSWVRAKLMIWRRGKSLNAWASVTLTARHPRA